MWNEILEYSQQSYMVVWSVLLAIFTVLTTLTVVLGIGADLGIDFDLDGDMDGEVSADAGADGTFFQSFCIFLNIGVVPVTVVIMTVVALNWGIGLELNQLFNSGHNILLGWGMACVTFFITIPISKIFTWPLKKFFKALNEDKEDQVHIIGNLCETVTTITVSSGQAKIKDGPTLVGLMVECEEGKTINKGKKAVILERNHKTNRCLISEVDDHIFN
ncbi:MAG: DUF1449 family protein [Lentisphaeraceae bacterium]|nr:DUF1449 family protein [Lentisphaeraceae bacterium]